MLWTFFLALLSLCHRSLWCFGFIFIKIMKVFNIFVSVLTQWSLSTESFSFHEVVGFLFFLLLLKSKFNQLWIDNMQSIVSIFLHLLRLAFSLTICSILENVPWGTEKNVYYFVSGRYVLQISVRTIWFITSVSFIISLLSFCLDDFQLVRVEC